MLEAIYGPELNKILQEMEEIYPPVNPKPNDSIAKVMYMAGQRSVIEWLHNRIE